MRWFAALAVVVVVAGSPLTGQEASVVAAVKAADTSWRLAYLACDAETWDALLADDLTFLHNNGSVDDKSKQMASVRGCGLKTLDSTITSVRTYGDDTAVVMGALKGETKGGFGFDLLYTRVYVIQDGGWRLVAHQSTDAPK